jgi:hypothetical protein
MTKNMASGKLLKIYSKRVDTTSLVPFLTFLNHLCIQKILQSTIFDKYAEAGE